LPPTGPRPALFLDRDGVLNTEVDYLHDPRDLAIIPGAARTVAGFNRAGLPVVVVTNQAGIGRGYYDRAAYESVNRAMADAFAAEGARLDAWYHCPHAPGDGCDCRKPRPGMLRAAANDLGLDLARSALVGDKLSDLGAAIAVGAKPFLVRTGHGARDEQKLASLGAAASAVEVFDSLADAEPVLRSFFHVFALTDGVAR
jgi:D-glycero-D-manno-heptose 1,7-bisphosphate phosphatase